jgi:hypothetical protein
MSSGNDASSFVFISGATGDWGEFVNGGYDRTSEIINGYPVYIKRFAPNICIAHWWDVWGVTKVEYKGTRKYAAIVKGRCALEDCVSRMWTVAPSLTSHDGNSRLPFFSNFSFTWPKMPSVKMVTGAEAERAVSGPCIGAARHRLTLKTHLYPSFPHPSLRCCHLSLSSSHSAPVRDTQPPSLLRRLLHTLLRIPLLLPTTTQKLPLSSSAAPQVAVLRSTARTLRRRGEGGMGGSYMSTAVTPHVKLNTILRVIGAYKE